MKRLIRTSLVAVALTAAVAEGGWTAHATQDRREAHPVLRNSIHQIEAINLASGKPSARVCRAASYQ